ncbi:MULTISPECIES: RtcB family protein [unclassified Acinetobacter]|uniref:RtcB family protein n=1 Tax=unclassified Acinetobacter TaxID=196816 RepID=UPI002448423A|nr:MULTISPECIES: RtcB family protein [unclassified Acinetobacter]MDH0030579.1 RtcB family protein [Acinetobacter sp. GD04021]MDH0886310.1 RtcB family protein [Acinetobacter sp. GD03873]MDH1081715.1 RtcB family protein [Acinetobacter sp. GD03983]MDH2189787.1 RtcB family protein [Acinetobacter sp. GD03645]MDH2202779.1 RtcB family protein [Acinetobacter sp. GD03647]
MGIQKILNAEAHYGVPVKIFTNDIDSDSIEQLKKMAQLQFIYSHIAVMPDVHVGKGATVGSVIPTQHAIIPAAVGVDIGCGMNAVRLNLKASQLPDNLAPLRHAIERKVPVGFELHKQIKAKASSIIPLEKRLQPIIQKHPGLVRMLRKFDATWQKQLGTLGGGNHFIELCLDENQDVWIMLHSGSRGLGNVIGTYFIELAKKEAQHRFGHVPDKDLSYFAEGSANFNDYVEAVEWAQNYAFENRREMMRLILEAIRPLLPPFQMTKEAINCHHNYVSRENHFGEDLLITRKGAIRAGQDELGIIPGSMGARSYIVKGKANPESFCSCSHGAGRKMSRNKAKLLFSQDDLIQQTQGIECRKDAGVIDEIPSAYKDIDQVMANQSDLIEIVHILKQILCIKG